MSESTPGTDPVGTVRRDPQDGEFAVKERDDRYPWRRHGPSVFVHDRDVVNWPVIGAVPGTPAAEVEPATDGPVVDALTDALISWWHAYPSQQDDPGNTASRVWATTGETLPVNLDGAARAFVRHVVAVTGLGTKPAGRLRSPDGNTGDDRGEAEDPQPQQRVQVSAIAADRRSVILNAGTHHGVRVGDSYRLRPEPWHITVTDVEAERSWAESRWGTGTYAPAPPVIGDDAFDTPATFIHRAQEVDTDA